MDLEIIILSEVNLTEKDKYHMIISYMWNLKKKKDTNELIYKTDSDFKNEFMVAKEERQGGGII